MKSHVTVIPADRIIIVNGEPLRFDFPAPIGLHALQWHEGTGHMEWTGDCNRSLNGAEMYAEEVSPFVTLWEKEKSKREKEANPAPTLEERRASAIQAVKDRSWRAEVSGISIQGMPIPTDRESQAMITGAVVGTLLDPDKVTRWQTSAVTAEGTPVFVDLSAAQLQGIGMAVRAHVQACFDVRDAKCAQIPALESVEAVDAWLAQNLNMGWPNA